MNALGNHILAEISSCNSDTLSNLNKVREIMTQAAIYANAEIRESVFHKFYPHGVSGVVVIAESHLAIHTWPELGYAAIDIYTCGDHTKPWVACEFIANAFESNCIKTTEVERGIADNNGIYSHKVISKKVTSNGVKANAQNKELAMVS
jgi:S-adenosylmethionine decarboxylase